MPSSAAYGELMPHGRIPRAQSSFLEVPPSELDVNVHPPKRRCGSPDARGAWDAIHTGLTRVLARANGWSSRRGSGAVEPARAYALGGPTETRCGGHRAIRQRMPATWWMPPSHAFAPRAQADPQPELVPRAPGFRGLRYLGQLHRTYLVCEGPQDWSLVDQHAAHERINYQRLRARSDAAGVQPAAGAAGRAASRRGRRAVAEAAEMLASIGVELESFGGTSAAVKALPAPLARLDETGLGALLTDLADELASHGRGTPSDRLRNALLARAACHGSVRAHDPLSAPEAQALLDALDETDYGARCATAGRWSPNGTRPRSSAASGATTSRTPTQPHPKRCS